MPTSMAFKVKKKKGSYFEVVKVVVIVKHIRRGQALHTTVTEAHAILNLQCKISI